MLFGGKDIIAVDIGTNNVKIAELDVSSRGIVLKKFAVQSLPPSLVDLGEIKDPTAVASTVQNILVQYKFKRKYAAAHVWGSAVLIKKIMMPQMDARLMREQIRWEAEQYIPFDINEVAIDFHILNRKSGDSSEVLLIAAKQDYLFRLIETVETAGLKCAVVDVGTLALANCFEANYGKQPGVSAVLNIGGGAIGLVIIEDGEVIHARDLPVGGSLYTAEIHKNLGLTMAEAESMKLSASSGSETPSEVLNIITSVNEQITEEIRNAFEFVMTAANLNMSNAKVYVTGGSIGVLGLLDAINKSLGIQCETLDPLLQIKTDPKFFSPEVVENIRNLCAVAVGLGIRKVSEPS